MAKRFTDTDKWRKPNLAKLSLRMKLVQLYLWDSCDHAGVWDINIDLLNFQTGADTTLEEIMTVFESKVLLVDSDKLFMPSFIEFQYGQLNPLNRTHKSVMDRIAKINEKNKPLVSPLEGVKDTDKDTVKDKDTDKEPPPKIIVPPQLSLPVSQEALIQTFNKICAEKGKIRTYNGYDLPREALIDFMNQSGKPGWQHISDWEKAFSEIPTSDYLTGKVDGFTMTLPWILKPDKLVNLVGGLYANKDSGEKALKKDSVDSGAKADKLFEDIIRTGRYEFSRANHSSTDLRAIELLGGLAVIFDCTNFTMEKVKAQFRAAYKQANEEVRSADRQA